MLGLIGRGTRKHRSAKFVPTFSAGVSGGLLEARALTAPAIWRCPTTDPAEATDTVQAGPVTGVNSAFAPVNQTWTSGSSTFTMTGSSSATVVDLVNPPAPADPVGTDVVTFSTSAHLASTVSGPWDGTESVGTGSNIVRNYVLADDTTASGPSETLQETFGFQFTAAANGLAVMNVNFTSPGATVTANGATGVSINNTAANADGNSHTITTATGTITYTLTQNAAGQDFNMTVTTNVGVLPLSQHNNNGTQSGLAWRVDTTADLSLTAAATAQTALTTSYKAQFV